MISLAALLQKALNAKSLEDFLAVHPHAVLISENPVDVSGGRDSCLQTVAAGSRAALSFQKQDQKRSQRHVIVIEKKSRSKFSNMISVGRTASNDVEIDHSSVSKFHAYFFQRENGEWYLQDANSSNGTFVEGHKIAAETPTKITEGWAIQFSSDTCYRFFTPGGLFQHLKSIQGDTR